MGNIMLPVHAESDPLKPADIAYENGNIVLHKQATRTAADEWEIDVQAQINDTPVEPPKLEVVFVLDTSGTMNCCSEEKIHAIGTHYYNHDNCEPMCGISNHAHESSCYLCGLNIQVLPKIDDCYYIDDSGIVYYQPRFEIATQVIDKMITALPAETQISRVRFSDRNYALVVDTYSGINPSGNTYLMEGVDIALDQFTDDPTTRKVMIIVTDGESDDSYDDDTGEFQAYKDNHGTLAPSDPATEDLHRQRL